MQLATLDWILLAVLGLSMLIGAWRGIVAEIFAIAGWVASYVLAQIFADVAGQVLPLDGMGAPPRYAAGFAAVFVLSLIACSLLTWVAKKMIESVGLRPIDRTLGAAFGALRGALITLAVATAVLMTPLKNGAWWQQSLGAGLLTSALQALKPVLPAQYGHYIQAAASVPPAAWRTALGKQPFYLARQASVAAPINAVAQRGSIGNALCVES
jgi:membrane protein required for colicin V production